MDDLPVELLMKIFSYLPSYSNVSLVSKRFYEVACNVNEVCLSLGSYFFVSKTTVFSVFVLLIKSGFDHFETG